MGLIRDIKAQQDSPGNLPYPPQLHMLQNQHPAAHPPALSSAHIPLRFPNQLPAINPLAKHPFDPGPALKPPLHAANPEHRPRPDPAKPAPAQMHVEHRCGN